MKYFLFMISFFIIENSIIAQNQGTKKPATKGNMEKALNKVGLVNQDPKIVTSPKTTTSIPVTPKIQPEKPPQEVKPIEPPEQAEIRKAAAAEERRKVAAAKRAAETEERRKVAAAKRAAKRRAAKRAAQAAARKARKAAQQEQNPPNTEDGNILLPDPNTPIDIKKIPFGTLQEIAKQMKASGLKIPCDPTVTAAPTTITKTDTIYRKEKSDTLNKIKKMIAKRETDSIRVGLLKADSTRGVTAKQNLENMRNLVIGDRLEVVGTTTGFLGGGKEKILLNKEPPSLLLDPKDKRHHNFEKIEIRLLFPKIEGEVKPNFKLWIGQSILPESPTSKPIVEEIIEYGVTYYRVTFTVTDKQFFKKGTYDLRISDDKGEPTQEDNSCNPRSKYCKIAQFIIH